MYKKNREQSLFIFFRNGRRLDSDPVGRRGHSSLAPVKLDSNPTAVKTTL